jgi:hypothetical protein
VRIYIEITADFCFLFIIIFVTDRLRIFLTYCGIPYFLAELLILSFIKGSYFSCLYFILHSAAALNGFPAGTTDYGINPSLSPHQSAAACGYCRFSTEHRDIRRQQLRDSASYSSFSYSILHSAPACGYLVILRDFRLVQLTAESILFFLLINPPAPADIADFLRNTALSIGGGGLM